MRLFTIKCGVATTSIVLMDNQLTQLGDKNPFADSRYRVGALYGAGFTASGGDMYAALVALVAYLAVFSPEWFEKP